MLMKYKHAVWLLYFPFYFIAFSLAEKYITSGYWISYLPLDDSIPFVGEFVLAYLLWFPAVWGMGILLLFIDPAAFRRYIWSIMIGYTISLAVYFIFPNGQDLRPGSFDHSNILIRMVQSFYQHDTNTNVLPSMHVIGASAVMFNRYDRPVSEPSTQPVANPQRKQRLRIVVADDDRDAVVTLAAILQSEGHEVREVYRGSDPQAAEFEQRLWKDFWRLLEDESFAKQHGVRVAQGEGVWWPPEQGKLYTLSIASDGGLELKSEPVKAIYIEAMKRLAPTTTTAPATRP
jgi:hypothetical protein